MKNHFFKILIVLGVVPILLGFLGRLSWFFDLFSHFRLYYLFYFLVIGLIAFIFRKKKEAAFSIGLALFLSFSVFKFYLPNSAIETNTHQTLKIASINLLSSNINYGEVLSFVEEGDFDIVFFQELNIRWQNEIEKVKSYPNQFHIPRPDNFGFGVISKVELDSVQNVDLSDVEIPSLLVSVEFEGNKLNILGTHPLPPIGRRYFESRNNQFEAINDFINESDSELILIGDLNSTVFSPNFKRLNQSGKLRDSRIGFGILPTWNAHWGLISITLDHAFVTDGIEVINRSVGEPNGSDHLPVTLEIGMKE